MSFTDSGDSYIICGWLINKSVTAVAGDVTFEITATGTNEKSADYRWRTRPNGKFTVLEALSYDGIIEPSDDWYAGFVKSMQEYTTKAAESARSAQDYADQSKSNLDQVTQITETFTTNAQEVKETAINEINNAKVSGVNAVEAAATEIVNDREKITENANNISSLKQDLGTLSSAVVEQIISDNIYNGQYTQGLNVTVAGDFTSDSLANYWTSDYIPVESGMKIWVKYYTSNPNETYYRKWNVTGFNNNKGTRVEITENTVDRSYSIPDNIKYIRIAAQSIEQYIPSHVYVGYKDTTPFVEYHPTYLEPVLEKRVSTVENDVSCLKNKYEHTDYELTQTVVSKNSFDGTYEYPLNLFYNASYTNATDYFTTGYISVNPGDVCYAINRNERILKPRRIVCFDSDKNPLFDVETYNDDNGYSVQNGVAFIRFVFSGYEDGTHRPDDLMIAVGFKPWRFESYFTPYDIISPRYLSYYHTDFSKKRIAVLGDSIMSPQKTNIGDVIISNLNAISVGNYAIGNATAQNYSTDGIDETEISLEELPNATGNKNVLSNQVLRLLQSTTDVGEQITWSDADNNQHCIDTSIGVGTGMNESPDIIFICIGTNDGMTGSDNLIHTNVIDDSEAVITESYSELTKTSIASGMRWAIETLKYAYPNAEIFVSSPIQSAMMNGNHGYVIKKTKRDIIQAIAEFESVHFIDAFADSGYGMNVAKNNGDGVHPNPKWRDKLAAYFANEIKNRYTE